MRRRTVLVGILIVSVGFGPAPVAAEDTTVLHGDRFPLAPTEQQVVSGDTPLEQGTELTVRIRSDDSSTPFLRQETAYVTENGSFAAVFDLSDITANTSVTVTAISNGTELAMRNATVAPCATDCRDTVPELPGPPAPDIAVEQGDVATIPVTTEGRDTVIFSLGSEDVNYVTNATLTDGNEDGEVAVRVDTANAGTDEPTLSVADSEDSLTVTRSEPALSSTLDAADYEYRVYRADDTAGAPDTVATMTVEANESGQEVYAVEDSTELEFEQSIYRAQQGDTAHLNVSLGTTDAATVSIGSPANGYEINATVRDGDGDGTVTLLFDTAVAGRSGTTLRAAEDADSVDVIAGSELQRTTPIEAGEYDLALYSGTRITASAEDIGTLSLQDADTAGGSETSPRVTTATNNSDNQSSVPELVGVGTGALVIGGVIAVGGIGIVLRSIGN